MGIGGPSEEEAHAYAVMEYITLLSIDGLRLLEITTGTTTSASLLQACLHNPFEGWTSANEIYGCPIHKRIAVTGANDQSIQI